MYELPPESLAMIRKLVDESPPLTPGQLSRMSTLIGHVPLNVDVCADGGDPVLAA